MSTGFYLSEGLAEIACRTYVTQPKSSCPAGQQMQGEAALGVYFFSSR